jgi:hypothetical protein
MHFAAFAEVGESMLQPAKYFQNNTCATLTLLETCPLIFAAKTFKLAGIFDTYHSEAGDGCKQLEIALGEHRSGAARFEVDESDRFVFGYHWHAKKRPPRTFPVVAVFFLLLGRVGEQQSINAQSAKSSAWCFMIG